MIPHRVKYNVNPFAASQFYGWNEVAIPGDKNSLLYLMCYRQFY